MNKLWFLKWCQLFPETPFLTVVFLKLHFWTLKNTGSKTVMTNHWGRKPKRKFLIVALSLIHRVTEEKADGPPQTSGSIFSLWFLHSSMWEFDFGIFSCLLFYHLTISVSICYANMLSNGTSGAKLRTNFFICKILSLMLQKLFMLHLRYRTFPPSAFNFPLCNDVASCCKKTSTRL